MQLTAQDIKINGFAGEDKQIAFLECETVKTKCVQLGTTDPGRDCVFNWRVISKPIDGEFSFDDAHMQRPTFTFNKTPGEYEIEVTRVSIYGYQREYVIVEVKNHIELVDVYSKKRCWQPGDEVELNDFELTIRPPGFENCFRVHPDDAKIAEDEYLYKKIRFQVREPGEPEYTDCEVNTEIFVTNYSVKDIVEKVEAIMNFKDELKERKQDLDKLKSYCKIIKGCTNKLDGLKTLQKAINRMTPPAAPITTTSDLRMDTVNMDLKLLCCNDEPAFFLEWSGGIYYYTGIEVNCQIFPAVPKLGLQLIGEMGAGIDLEAKCQIALPKYYKCYQFHIPVDVYGKCALGVQLMAFDEDLLSAKATISAEVHGGLDFTIEPELAVDFINTYVKVEFTVYASFIGFNRTFHPFEEPIIVDID